MEYIIFVNKGFEDVACIDIEQFGMSLVKKYEGFIIVKSKHILDVCKYSYSTQLANSVAVFIGKSSEVENLKLPKEVETLLDKTLKFRINSRIGYEEEVGLLFNEYSVDLKNPGFSVELFEHEEEFFLCLDLSGDLSKRDYKLFNSPLSLKGTTAFGILMLSGYKKDKSLLDPFINSGTIAIEAALFSNNIPHKLFNKNFPFTKFNISENNSGKKADMEFFDDIFSKIEKKMKSDDLPITAADPLLKNVTAAKKNAKIARVEKCVEFRRIDIDWMDIKHEKRTFDYIITFIAGTSKHKDQKRLLKEYSQFFYQAEYIIKKSGTLAIACLSKNLLMDAAIPYFDVKETKDFYSGNQLMHLLIFTKKAKNASYANN
ncbi:MAG: hypothetical protein ACP5NV_06295 [Candidatus Woesearchaeota archaeon]